MTTALGTEFVTLDEFNNVKDNLADRVKIDPDTEHNGQMALLDSELWVRLGATQFVMRFPTATTAYDVFADQASLWDATFDDEALEASK